MDDYLELVDTLGRSGHPEKGGFLSENPPAILERLEIDVDTFIKYANSVLKKFGAAEGTAQNLIDLAAARQSRYAGDFRGQELV